MEPQVTKLTLAVGETRLAFPPEVLSLQVGRGCFLLTLYDPEAQIGAVARLKMPSAENGSLGEYTLVTIQRLIAEMYGKGARKERIETHLGLWPTPSSSALRTIQATLRWQGLRNAQSHLCGAGRELRFHLSNGAVSIHEVSATPQTHNLTEVAIALSSQILDLRAFTDQASAGSSHLALTAMLQQIADIASLMFGGSRCFIAMNEEHTGRLAIRADSSAGTLSSAVDLELARAFLKHGGPFLPDLPTSWARTRWRSIIGAQLTVNGEPSGVLCAVHPEPNAFGQREVRLLQFLARQISIAIQNARLYHRLQKKAEEMEAILEGIGDGIIVTDPELRLVMANPVAQRLLRLDPETSLGQSLPADSPLANLLLGAVGNAPHVGEITLEGNSERPIICQATVSRIMNERGQWQGLVAVLRDVTTQREMEKVRSNLMSIVSHELKTPLHTISGFVDIILMGKTGPLNELQRDFLTTVRQQSIQLQNIINDLLEFSRLEYGPIKLTTEPAHIQEIANNVMRKFVLMAQQQQITLIDAVPEGLPAIEGDSVRLEQVLTNLVDNAIKFTPEGGQVTLGAEDLGQEILLWVSDTGIGIPVAEQTRIFDKFYQAAEQGGTRRRGAGLGLAICKNIVERHHGRIWVESEPGRGSTFYVTLPKRQEPTSPAAQETPAPHPVVLAPIPLEPTPVL